MSCVTISAVRKHNRAEDPDLSQADPLFHYSSDRWFPPDTEGRYEKAMESLETYLTRLSDPAQPDAQFYARADNLRTWLELVEKRLGSLSQRLSASVGQERLNTDLAGDYRRNPIDPVTGQKWM